MSPEKTLTEPDRLFQAIPEPVVGLCRRLAGAGKRGWVVGGCVRDSLLGLAAKDWDVATDARPEEVQRIFRRVIPTGIKHGTVTVVLGGVGYEVTTLRGEGEYRDGRHPEAVTFLDDIEEDLARRDFTFNAIALDPLARTIVDPFDGQRDLARGLLRAVGVALERFVEDGLRVLRAARFAAALECEVEASTLRAMAAPEAHRTLAKVSPERVHDEWQKAMKARRPSIAFSLMRSTEVLPLHAPELASLADDVYARGLERIDRCPSDPPLRLAALCLELGDTPTLGADEAEALLRRLRFSNDDRNRILHLVRHQLAEGDAPSSWSDAALRRWLRAVTPSRLDDVVTLAEASREGDAKAEASALGARARAMLAEGVALETRDLAVRGKDLMQALELSPGRHIGELLEALLERVLDEPSLNQAERLIEVARGLRGGAA